jgi:hypothetical protein
MILITEIPPAKAVELWEKLETFVRVALAHDPYSSVTVSEVLRQIERGYCRVLIASNDSKVLSATCVQLFKSTDGERVLHVLTTAGEGADLWMDALTDTLDHMAREQRCRYVTMAGRPGWQKKLARMGFRSRMVYMRREVDGSLEKQTAERKPASEPRIHAI